MLTKQSAYAQAHHPRQPTPVSPVRHVTFAIRRQAARAALLCLLMAVPATTSLGQSSHADPYRFWKWPMSDAAALGGHLLSRGVIYAAGGGLVLLVAAPHDREVTETLADLPPPPADLVVRIVEEFGNVRSVRPVAGAVFLGSLISENHRFQDAAFTSLEAVIYANLITSGLKSVFGRARPWQEQGATEFDPFSGNTSFPSGHSTTAFAFVTPYLLYYPNMFTPGLLLLSAGTAFSRMLTQNHWFTDVVAGSTIGFATAYFLHDRHEELRRIRLAPKLGAEQYGITISIEID